MLGLVISLGGFFKLYFQAIDLILQGFYGLLLPLNFFAQLQ